MSPGARIGAALVVVFVAIAFAVVLLERKPAPSGTPAAPATTRPSPGGDRSRRDVAQPAAGGRTPEQIAEGQRKHKALLAQLEEAEKKRAAAASNRKTGGGEEGGDAPTATLDAPYIRSRIQEITPLVAECYEHALEKNPRLSGKLTVKFNIVGDKQLGGLVDKAEIMQGAHDAGELPRSEMDECLTATIESVTFAAPKGDGHVTVHYPFVFASDEPEADLRAPL